MIKKISRTSDSNQGTGIDIQLSDGSTQHIDSKRLRQACPCAHCLEESGKSVHAKPLTPKKSSILNVIEATREESLDLVKIWSLGNYALGMQWGDGHDSGIYSFKLLEELAETSK